MKKLIALGAFLALLAPAAARADNYLLICSPGWCQTSDGLYQPAGTAVARVNGVGSAPSAPAGEAAILDDGRVLYQPANYPPVRLGAVTASQITTYASITPGTLTIGPSGGNPITITGGATPGAAATITLGGSGGLTLPPISGPFSTPIGTSITVSGAKCDSVTDDTSAINSFLAGLPNGSTVVIPSGKFCLINSANMTVPAGVRIVGSGRPVQPQATAGSLTGSGFVLNPLYTITLTTGSELDNLGIWRSGLVVAPTGTQVISAVAQWGAEQSVAVTILDNEGGAKLDGDFIEGFNVGVKQNSGQFIANDVWLDDYNGFWIAGGGDNSLIENSRVEPYYAFGIGTPSLAWDRPGIAYEAAGGTTGWNFLNDQSFMWRNAFLSNNGGVGNLARMTAEYNSGASGQNNPGGDGARFLNGGTANNIQAGYFGGFTHGISNEGAELTVTGSQIVSSIGSAVNMGGGSFAASPPTITLSGTPAVGQTVTETVTSASITGSPINLIYTVVASDTLGSIARGLARLVNASSPLIVAPVFASYAGAVETTNWQAGFTASVSVATTGGGLVATLGSGTAPSIETGGLLSGINVLDNNALPYFSLGTASSVPNNVAIASPYLTNGTAAIPSGWLSFPSAFNGSTIHIALSGIPWSTDFAANLSACGTTPSIDAYANDGGGTITEGTTATGCTLTFETPFFKAPFCVLSSPSGASPLGYSSTTTALVITNSSASGDKFTYRCSPY